MPSASAQREVGNFTIEDIERKKKKYFELVIVPRSEMPYRVTKRRNGVVFGYYSTQEDADTFMRNYPADKMK